MFLLPCLSCGGVKTVLQNTTFEKRPYYAIDNWDFDATRPNQEIDNVTGPLSFNANGVISGYSGKLRLVIIGTQKVTCNGGYFSSLSGTVILHYSNSGGKITWY
jgi:hypothetical protein